jgi:hypothetical protein
VGVKDLGVGLATVNDIFDREVEIMYINVRHLRFKKAKVAPIAELE